jgi:uncharacterized protein (DUF952 family)
MQGPDRFVYKIAPRALWADAERAGVFTGSADDVRDGFIHFSTLAQTAETAAKHFAGQVDLVLCEVDAHILGAGLVWEPSRRGELFPHLYGVLPLAAVTRTWTLRFGADGVPILPEDLTRG